MNFQKSIFNQALFLFVNKCHVNSLNFARKY